MGKKRKNPQFTTKPAKALWPHLSSPDVTFNSKGVYHVKLVFTPEEFETDPYNGSADISMKELLDKAVEDAHAKAIDGMKPAQAAKVMKAYPYDDELDAEKEETGNIVVKFKSNASYTKADGTVVDLKPRLFDPAGKPITRKINIGNGSILAVNASIAPYYMKSTKQAGITLYMNGVQVKELVEYGASAESMGFETDGEGFDQGPSEVFQEETAGDGEGDF
jgi:hypothetical protein